MVFPVNPLIGENIEVSCTIKNVGGIQDTKNLEFYIDNSKIKDIEITLEPEQSETMIFPFSADKKLLLDRPARTRRWPLSARSPWPA